MRCYTWIFFHLLWLLQNLMTALAKISPYLGFFHNNGPFFGDNTSDTSSHKKALWIQPKSLSLFVVCNTVAFKWRKSLWKWIYEFLHERYLTHDWSSQLPVVTQPKIHVSAAYCTLCVMYVTFGLQLSQSFLYINIKTDEALYGLG